MEALETWFDTFTSTPMGAVLTFLAIFLMRVAIDERRGRRRERDQDERRRKAS